MKNNKIWRVEKMEFISDDSENKDNDGEKNDEEDTD